jgi:uncharacterized protein
MKIYVSRVPDEGLREHVVYDPARMDMERDDIRPAQPFEADVFVTRADEELVVQADIRCPLEFTCARCLEPFTSAVTPQGVFSYKVQPADVVDITEDVRQEVLLAYPMVPVCRPDCKGLCTVCGTNLNVSACSHQAERA